MASEFKRAPGKGFSDFTPQSGAPKAPGLKDLVEIFDYGSKKKYKPVRLVGPMEVIGLHKVKIVTKAGVAMDITKPCVAFNRKKGKLDQTKVKKCGYCNMGPQQYLTTKYFSNLIDREEQENKPKRIKEHTKEERKTGFRSLDSEAWSPVKVTGMPVSQAKRVKEIDDRNLVKDKKGKKTHYEIRDPDHGLDIEIKFDKDEKAANMYNAVRNDDGPSALTKDERKLLLWDLSVLYPPESSEQSFKEAKSMAERAPEEIKKELKKMGKKASSDSSSASSDSSASASSDSDKKDKKKSKKDSSDSSYSAASDSSDDKKSKKSKKDKKKSKKDDSSSSDKSGASDASSKNSDSSSSDSSKASSNSGSDASGSKSSDSSSNKGSKGSKSKASSKSKAKAGKGKSKAGKGKSDSSGSAASSDSEADLSGTSDSSDKKSKKSKGKDKKKSKKKDKSDASSDASGSDLSGIDSDASADSSSDKKSKKKDKSKDKKSKKK